MTNKKTKKDILEISKIADRILTTGRYMLLLCVPVIFIFGFLIGNATYIITIIQLILGILVIIYSAIVQDYYINITNANDNDIEINPPIGYNICKKIFA